MLVYDTTDENSFRNVRTWMRNIEQNTAPTVNKVSAILVWLRERGGWGHGVASTPKAAVDPLDAGLG